MNDPAIKLQPLVLKLSGLILTATAILAIFYHGLKIKDCSDPPPEVKILDSDAKKEFGSFAAKINLGLLIKNFTLFDIVKNNFIADLTVWFEFNTDKVMLDNLSLFSFDNGDILKKSPPDIKVGEIMTLAKYEVRVSFRSSLTYNRFPLENHRVSLILSNNFVTPSEMYFAVEDTSFKTATDLFIPDWKIDDLVTDAGFSRVGLDSKDGSRSVANPKAYFTMKLSKKGTKDAFVIFVPLYLAFFIGAYSFLTSLFNTTLRYATASSAVPALLGYRFVIQNLLPPVAYFTTTDYIYILLLLLSFAIFIVQTILIRQSNRISSGAMPSKQQSLSFLEKINSVVFVLINFLLILGTYYFILVMKG